MMVSRMGVGNGSGNRFQESRLVGIRKRGMSVGCGGSDLRMTLSAYDGIKSVDGISGVVDHATCTIGFQEAVLSLDHISVTALMLVLEVSGASVLNVVGKVVLWVGIVSISLLLDQRLSVNSQSGLGSIGQRSCVRHIRGCWQYSCADIAEEGKQADKLWAGRLVI